MNKKVFIQLINGFIHRRQEIQNVLDKSRFNTLINEEIWQETSRGRSSDSSHHIKPRYVCLPSEEPVWVNTAVPRSTDR